MTFDSGNEVGSGDKLGVVEGEEALDQGIRAGSEERASDRVGKPEAARRETGDVGRERAVTDGGWDSEEVDAAEGGIGPVASRETEAAVEIGVTREFGVESGRGVTLPELFALRIELSEAESNLTQALRAHFGFLEDMLASGDEARRACWLGRIGAGAIFSGAWSETGAAAKLAAFSTLVTGPPNDLRLKGTKFCTTGSLFADWIDVGVSDADGEGIGVVVSRQAAGVTVEDDWDGIGRTLTASGTATFTWVTVDPADITRAEARSGYAPAFFQLVQFATIGRALATDLATAVATRTRTYNHAAAPRSAADPQVLQVAGRVRGAAYAAGTIVRKVAEAVQRAADARSDPQGF